MFAQELLEAFKEHAKAMFPHEACAYIVNGELLIKENISDKPRESFQVHPDEYPLEGFEAVLHSHPNGDLWPSEEDQKRQIGNAVPWGLCVVKESQDGSGERACSDLIFWGSNTPKPPLLGRKYRFGPSGTDNAGDCYALIKDFFEIEHGVILPEFARSEDWFKNGGNLYADNFEKVGFERISKEDMKKGDVLLIQLRSKVPNHGGIYLGDGTMLHHCQDQLSRREPVARWLRQATHFLRYNGNEA